MTGGGQGGEPPAAGRDWGCGFVAFLSFGVTLLHTSASVWVVTDAGFLSLLAVAVLLSTAFACCCCCC